MNTPRLPDLPIEVRTVLELLEAAGYEAYTVGGCVRDALRGVAPHDWDVTTSALPHETEEVFRDYHVIETGMKHGTVTVRVNHVSVEVTTYRVDGTYTDGRHPDSVAFTRSLTEDLRRRDFTVNAMAYSERRGLVDLFGGQENLQARTIRAVGRPEDRFGEDALRILRALRFASTLDFEIAPDVREAIFSQKELLRRVSAERIREEFLKLLCGVAAERILREYHTVIGVFIPEIEETVGFEHHSKYHCFDVFEHSLHALGACTSDDPVTRLALLFHDIGKPRSYQTEGDIRHFSGHAEVGADMAREILRRLKFDNDTTDRVVRLVKLHDAPLHPSKKSVKRLLQKIPEEDFHRFLIIHRCDRIAHAPGFDQPKEEDEILALFEEIRAENACFSLADLAVNGTDLIALGIPRGAMIGVVLSKLLDGVIEEKYPNEKEALLKVAKKFVDRSQSRPI